MRAVVASCLAALLLQASSAQAQEHPDIALSLGVGSGFVMPLGVSGINSELTRAGYAPLSPVMPRVALEIYGHFGPVTIGMLPTVYLDARHTTERSYTAGGAFFTAGYQILPMLPFGVTPTIGIGFGDAGLCPKGGDGREHPDESAYQQLLRNPVRDTCLRTRIGVALRASVAIDYNLLFRQEDGSIAGVRFSLTPGLDAPFPGDAWRVTGGADLPDIIGPPAPPLAPFLALSVGFVLGM